MKDYKKILEGIVKIINTTEKSDIGFVNICTYIDENCPELKESEDEEIRKELIEKVKETPACIGFDNKNAVLAWLEKQSTPQVRTGLEWLNTIDDACDKRYAEEYAHGEYCHEQSFKWGFQEGVDWLEKQGEKKSAEWSEEDERMFNSALWHIKNSCSNGGKNSGEFEVYNWLKSLKPQSHWKPTEEQLSELRHAISGCSFETSILVELEENLKKLL